MPKWWKNWIFAGPKWKERVGGQVSEEWKQLRCQTLHLPRKGWTRHSNELWVSNIKSCKGVSRMTSNKMEHKKRHFVLKYSSPPLECGFVTTTLLLKLQHISFSLALEEFEPIRDYFFWSCLCTWNKKAAPGMKWQVINNSLSFFISLYCVPFWLS